jgi:hypothetical protein
MTCRTRPDCQGARPAPRGGPSRRGDAPHRNHRGKSPRQSLEMLPAGQRSQPGRSGRGRLTIGATAPGPRILTNRGYASEWDRAPPHVRAG